MKPIKLVGLVLAFGLTLTTAHAQTDKFAALAIDKANGFYYGWASDHPSLAEAEKRAMAECTKRGGSCSIVLSWSGAGCGVYRTIDGKVGTAYGWGIAATQAAADKIAIAEALKRSNGKPAINFVFGCNSNTKEALKTIQNDIDTIRTSAAAAEIKTVKIGDQIWMAENLNVSRFQNGDQIPEVKNWKEGVALKKELKPFFYDNNAGEIKYGKFYNWYAVSDPRGLCPKGWHVPSYDEWTTLLNYLGGSGLAGKKLQSTANWKSSGGTNETGFNALPSSRFGFVSEVGTLANWWSSTKYEEDFLRFFLIAEYGDRSEAKMGNEDYFAGLPVRCMKDSAN